MSSDDRCRKCGGPTDYREGMGAGVHWCAKCDPLAPIIGIEAASRTNPSPCATDAAAQSARGYLVVVEGRFDTSAWGTFPSFLEAKEWAEKHCGEDRATVLLLESSSIEAGGGGSDTSTSKSQSHARQETLPQSKPLCSCVRRRHSIIIERRECCSECHMPVRPDRAASIEPHTLAAHGVEACKPGTVKPGWKLVPVKPTEEMLEAALDISGQRVAPFEAARESGVPIEMDITDEDAARFNEEAKAAHCDIYCHMLQASPPPPQDGVTELPSEEDSTWFNRHERFGDCKPNEVYIGQGVFAEFDGEIIRLRDSKGASICFDHGGPSILSGTLDEWRARTAIRAGEK